MFEEKKMIGTDENEISSLFSYPFLFIEKCFSEVYWCAHE